MGNDPILLAGSLLRYNDVHFLPAGKDIPPRKFEVPNVTLHPAFGSYGILKKVASSAKSDYYKTLWSKAVEIPTWIGSCNFDSQFEEVLEAFSSTKFGGMRVTRSGEEALLTLGEVVGLISERRLSTHMLTDDVCSIPSAIAGDQPIIEAIKKMISDNIRRLFVQGGKGRFISDRTIIEYMFSPRRLEIARDHPEEWINGDVSELPTKVPGRCKTGDLDEAAKAMGKAPDDCLTTDEWMVISRWDLVVKPWRARKLTAE